MTDADSRNSRSDAGIQTSIDALAARVAAIEAHLGLGPALANSAPPAGTAPQPASGPAPVGTARPDFQLPAFGVSFLMLAGAFLLRALTGSGTVGDTAGVILGLAYVAVLLFLTDRAARRGQSVRANLFGVSTVLVAYPFLWETTTKLELLPARSAVAVTALVVAVGLTVSLRHRLKTLSWITLLAAVATSAGLYWTTEATELFLAFLVALGAATVWLAYLRDWSGPRWPVAGVVNFLVFVTAMLAAHPARHVSGRPLPDPEGALLLAIALPVVYLGSFGWRTLVVRREAGIFEILQSLGCIAAGYVGAIHLLRVADRSTAVLGWATLVSAVAAYVAAFMLVRGRQGRGLNFFYYAWLGLALMLIGSALVVSGQLLPFLWCGLAVATAITGGLYDRWTLRLHCAAYLVGANLTTGLPAAAVAAFAAPRLPTWPDWSVSGLAVWAATVVAYGLLRAMQREEAEARWRRIPRFLTAALALAGTGVLVVIGFGGWLVQVIAGPDLAIVSAVRTTVLAGTALLLAALGRRPGFLELAWFTGPLLVLTALKVLFEDLRHGTPVSLFVGFACFGVALILAPRLRRQESASDPDTEPKGDHGHETP